MHRSHAMASGDSKLIQEIDDLDTALKYKEYLSCELLWRFARWYGIFLDLEGQQEGTKKRIENAYKVKEYFQKAVELNENDYATLHALGIWCYTVASLGKIERVFARAFFSAPPTSSYEEVRWFARLSYPYRLLEYAAKVLEFAGTDEETNEVRNFRC
ncbi:unnamed protein product [Schistocephalus solidus]|uniref:Regulator of microtubule dynamics protein 1 n=1 Tax=Schistocephalus solidus TaxID=70667 RepID=A0A3P7DDX5_SCHSO|nr:unnamed protein product [Schistocephalus solidus]